MTTAVLGTGWVTPLGNNKTEVWERLVRSERAEVKSLSGPNGRSYFHVPVPPPLVESLSRIPRLRRSSSISYYAVQAGLAALEDAGISISKETAERIAVVFAVASGGVIYTRRFYELIATQGAQAASPLLFPETVYNAPASHLASMLGVTGMSYTMVGDASVGMTALNYAKQLLEMPDIDYCLVVGSEEVDWVLCEAYREWRLAATEPHLEIYQTPSSGTLLADGAAALLLGREGNLQLKKVHEGITFFSRAEAGDALRKVYADLLPENDVDLIIGGANGSYIDHLEHEALEAIAKNIPVYCPKPALGEALGATSLMQVIAGIMAMQTGTVPDVGYKNGTKKPERIRNVMISTMGFNYQASGLVLSAK